MESSQLKLKSGGRLDKVLSSALGVSRNQVEKLIKEGFVAVDGKQVLKPSFKVAAGMLVAYEIQEAKPESFEDIDLDIEVLYEDDDIMVLNKPAGLVVHPAPSVKEATLVDWLRKQNIRLSTISGEERNGIVHRLDKETSGALLVAKSDFAHTQLSKQLQDRSMGRYYLAVINYPFKEDTVVDKPIARNPKNRLKMAIVEGGREAKTAFVKVAQSKGESELIACKLFSGRTHQIRVHLGTLGRHIVGDKLYAPSKESYKHRMFLHAYLLYFIHPRSGKRVEVLAPLFDDMQEYIEVNFEKGSAYVSFNRERIEELFKDTAS